MIEERIVEKFSALGYLSKGNEWYFPIENVKPLIDACQKQNVSIIGVEFFHKEGEKLMPVDPINAIDCSVLLHKYSRWDDVVDCCFEFVRKILIEEDIPEKYTSVLGNTTRERLNTLISDIVKNSEYNDDICMSEEIKDAMMGLREFMFERVYSNPTAKGEEQKAKKMLTQLFEYYVKNKDRLPSDILKINEARKESPERAVCDYIAGMSDQYSVMVFKELFVPAFWER